MPDLPKANYSVWVRGYGLVDSPKVQATPGKTLNLTAVAAPNARAAAEYYPAGYWFSLIRIPEKSEFPGTGPGGNGISPNMKTQAEWLSMPEVGRLHGLSPARQQGHARDPEGARHVSQLGRGVGAPHPVGTGRRADERAA